MNKYWERYEKGLDYITKKNLISKTDRNWNFYSGRQWEGVKMSQKETDLPFLNFIKPTIKHKVSTVSQNNMVANYSDMLGREELSQVYDRLNVMFSQCWEKANEDMELWTTVKDSAVTGDGIQYFGTSDVGDMQKLSNTAILYGDESEPDVQKQPYLIIHHRLAVSTVREEARRNGLSEDEIKLIVPDSTTEYMVGNRDEVTEGMTEDSSKVTCIIHFEKKDGVVHVCKCTSAVIYEPEHPIQATNADGTAGRGLRLYPLVKISWENFPNSARGLSEVEQLIPNQLEVNKTLARRSMIIKLTAYPRIAYDVNAIQNPEALTEVGMPIEVMSGSVQSINQMISYLNPAQTTSEPKNYADDLMSLSQELSGSGETAMGNINPNRVAASAIIAIRDQAALPLNEQVAKMKTFVEDLAKLWVEIWCVYNPNGFDVFVEEVDELTGEKVKRKTTISRDELDMLMPDVRIDTSQDNPWTKEAEQNWLDGVLDKQHITFEEYINASPEHGIIPKNKMQTIIENRKRMQQLQAQQQMAQQPLSEAEIASNAEAVWAEQDGLIEG